MNAQTENYRFEHLEHGVGVTVSDGRSWAARTGQAPPKFYRLTALAQIGSFELRAGQDEIKRLQPEINKLKGDVIRRLAA